MANSQKETGSALHKSVMVLDALFDSGRSMSLAELSQYLDLPRQTVHRIVRQMEDLDLIRRDFSRDRFAVGGRMLSLGINALCTASHAGPMRATLKNLVAEIGETCNIGVLDRDEVVYIDRVECDWPLRLQYGPGSRIPFHATAIGKLLLTHLPSRTRRRLIEAAPLEKFTETTIIDPAGLEDEVRQIRRQGFATNNQERIAGLIGLAVPINDGDGRVVAGLAMHGPEARGSVADAERDYLPALRAAAEKIESQIGVIE